MTLSKGCKLLDLNELAKLEDAIKANLDEKLPGILTTMNRTGRLGELLELLGMPELMKQDSPYKVYKSGKIVVIGASEVKEKDLRGIARSLGVSPDRLECHLNYDDAKYFQFEKMRYEPKYSLVMFGPMPHSGVSKGSYSSMIANIEQSIGYPPVVRLGSQGLKITKTGFRNALEERLKNGVIVAG